VINDKSRGSVAVRLRCGGIFSDNFSGNLLFYCQVRSACEIILKNRSTFGEVTAKVEVSTPVFDSQCSERYRKMVMMIIIITNELTILTPSQKRCGDTVHSLGCAKMMMMMMIMMMNNGRECRRSRCYISEL